MSQFKWGFLPREISKTQARDTGMAMVLICLLLTFLLHNNLFAKIAIGLLVINMTIPSFFTLPAYLWFGLSHFVGSIVSRILLTVIYFVIVTPVGLLRRLFGFDSLRLRKFGKGTESVMINRNQEFRREDLDRPY